MTPASYTILRDRLSRLLSRHFLLVGLLPLLAICCGPLGMSSAFAKIGLSGEMGASYFLTKALGAWKAREILFLRQRLNEILAKHTGQSLETIARDTERIFVRTPLRPSTGERK